MTKEELIKYIEDNYQVFTDTTFIGEYYKVIMYHDKSEYESVNSLYEILKNTPDATKQELINYFKDHDFIQYLLAYSYQNYHLKVAYINDIATAKIIDNNDEVIEALYSELVNTFNDSEKISLISKLNNYRLKDLIAKQISNYEMRQTFLKEIHLSVLDFEEKILTDIANSHDEETQIRLALTLFTDQAKLQAIKMLPPNLKRSKIATTLATDEACAESLQYLNEAYEVSGIALRIKNDALKFQALTKITDEKQRTEIARTLKDEQYIMSAVDYITDENTIMYLATFQVESDELKIKLLDRLTELFAKLRVIGSIKSDAKKIKYLKSLFQKHADTPLDLVEIFYTIVNLTNSYNIYTYRDLIIQIFDKVDKFGKYNCLQTIAHLEPEFKDKCYEILYDRIITFFSQKEKINLDKLKHISLLFGNRIFEYLDNDQFIKLINTLTPEEFAKLHQLFEYPNITMQDVYGIYNSLIQQKFNVEHKEEREAFSQILNYLDHQDFFNINALVERISHTSGILKVFYNSRITKLIHENLSPDFTIPQDEISFQKFLLQLITQIIDESNQSKIENLTVLLHEIIDFNITLIRDQYVKKSITNISQDLNLKVIHHNKEEIFKEFLTNDLISIIETLSNVYSGTLNSQVQDLLNHPDILAECLKFKKDPENYQPTIISKEVLIKQYLRYFSQLLNTAYDQGLLKEIELVLSLKKGTNTPPVKDYEVKTESDYYNILLELDSDFITEKLLPNDALFSKIKFIMHKFKLANWSDMFTPILESLGQEFSSETLADLINHVDKISLEKLETLKPSDIISLINMYSNVYNPEKSILGLDNYIFLANNPSPNSASMKKQIRLTHSLDIYRQMYARDTITIPPMNEVISIKNEKRIRVVVGDITNPINLTLGERTGACMRIGGVGSTLFDFCNLNPSGFHIRFENPDTGKLISRVSGFRNGNTIFLNELRESLDEKYSNLDLFKSCQIVARRIIDLANEQHDQINNVVISSDYAMKESGLPEVPFNIDDIKAGYNHFYTDIRYQGIVLSSTNHPELVPINLTIPKKEYPVSRQHPIICQDSESANHQMTRLLVIESLLTTGIPEITPNYENVSHAIVGEDWIIYTTKDGETVSKIINGISDERKKIATNEMIEYLSKYSQYLETPNNNHQTK